MLSLLLVIACFPQFITSSNLNLIFNTANSTCTAACSTCSDTSNTDTTTSNSNTALLEELLNTTRNNDQDIKVKIDGLMNTTTTNAGAINDMLLLVKDLLALHNESCSPSFSPLPTSCQEIKNKQPNSPSGVYLLAAANNDGNKYVYCNMDELCGSGGGWTRLAYLDMTGSTVNCPSGFKLYQSVRACGRAPSSVGSCTSVQFPSNGISYSQVCGRVVGYQFGSTDADYPGNYTDEPYGTSVDTDHNDINSYYVDGVSITRGSPRQHVWTLMAGLSSSGNHPWTGRNDSRYNCPCSPGSPQNSTLQSFIGNDYYCESGNPATDGTNQYILYTSDPLWDGIGCGSLEGNCCTAPGLPWFHKVLNTTTTNYLELRVCGDQGNVDEDTPVSFYELYIK